MRIIHTKGKIAVFCVIMGGLHIAIQALQDFYLLPYPANIIIAGMDDYTKFSPIVAIGYWTNEYNYDLLSKRYFKYYAVWGMFLFLLQVNIPFVFEINIGVVCVPIFISCILSFFNDLFRMIDKYKVKNLIVHILTLLGKNSTSIWFLHSIFFTPLRKIQWLAYFPRISLLIWCWTLFLCCAIVETFNYTRRVLHSSRSS